MRSTTTSVVRALPQSDHEAGPGSGAPGATVPIDGAASSTGAGADTDAALEIAALLDQARARLAGVEAAELSATGRSQVLLAVDRTMASLTTLRGRLLLAMEERGDWQTGADRSAAAWRGRTAGIGQRAARTQMAQAQTIQALPAVARGVEEGTVSTAHLDALARVTPRTSGPAREVLASPEGQAELVALAQRLDADTYAKAIERKVAEAEPAAVDRDHAAQHAARSLALTDTAGGTRIAGLLDRMAGHRLRLALEALSPRPSVDDERTHEQRWADALATMAEAVLSDPQTTPGAAVRPHVSFVMSEQSWLDLKTHAAARAAGEVLVMEGRPRELVTLEDGTPVPTTEIGRALCDCELTRVVVDAQSQPVDVGRTKRLYDGPLRRAIITRDGTCSWPGCPQHARWCEIHHIRWWDRDGAETSVDNGVLLCGFHHKRVHDHHLSITRDPVAPGQAAPNGLSTVRYEFRTPDGRLHVPAFGNHLHLPTDQPPDDPSPAPDACHRASDPRHGPPRRAPRRERGDGRPPGREDPAAQKPRREGQLSGGRREDEPEIELLC